MRLSTLIASALSAAVGVSAASLEPFLVHRVHPVSDASIWGGFGKRQTATGTGTVPSQCTSTCDPVNNEVNAGCPVTACCTPSFEDAYYACLECVGTALNATDYATAQEDLNNMGYVLPQLALPGQAASGSSSSSGSVPGIAPPTVTGSVIIATTPVPSTMPTAPSGATPGNGGGLGRLCIYFELAAPIPGDDGV
ncbi:hypothetical protein BU15DRAFT_60220 [Melanogaster broomeanus]|nr:hypothetical protein BU15DRAFT_60220 [Melanogaster broomeanus]